MPAMNIHYAYFVKDLRVEKGAIYMPELTHYGYDGSLHYTRANVRYERALVRKAKARFHITGQRPTRREESLTEIRQYFRKSVLVISRTCIAN